MTNPQNRRRMAGGRFPKGISGNPGGRPKAVVEVVELARQHTPAALATLAEIMATGESEQARIAAATALLERAWGKPVQPQTTTNNTLVLQSFTVEQLRELLQAMRGDQRELPESGPTAEEAAGETGE